MATDVNYTDKYSLSNVLIVSKFQEIIFLFIFKLGAAVFKMSTLTRRSVLLFKNSPVSIRLLSTVEVTAERKAMLDRMIRVDHAGEYGADRIYCGQVRVGLTGWN